MRIIVTCSIGILFGSALADPSPKVLIVPMRKSVASQVPTVSIGNYLAQELDADGRVSPIVWSLTDPAFRKVATGGTMGTVPDFPTKEKALHEERPLGATYVIVYSSEVLAQKINARVEIYQGSREIWHDVQSMSSQEAGKLSGEDTNRSIAHTWALLMFSTPFKTLASHPKTTTPILTKGQEPVSVAPNVLPVADNLSGIEKKVEEFRKNGKLEQAVSLTRDAIDSDPFNPALRLLLVQLYQEQKNWPAAADAAVRGSEVIPNNLELRQASVRSLISAGNTQQVRDQLNELIARDPNSQVSLSMQSQTYMILGDYKKAIETLDLQVKKFPQPSAYYWRALCRSVLGGNEGMDADIQDYLKSAGKPDSTGETCRESVRILQSVTQKDIDSALQLYQRAGISPNSPEVKDSLEQLQRDATARSGFLQQIAPAPALRESYGDLLVAQKLLLVSYISMSDVLKTASDDSMVDARINLGEAIKSLKASKQKLAAEVGDAELVKLHMDLF